jgi:hypothetical protein
MTDQVWPCIACGKILEAVIEPPHPAGGVRFTSRGNYGSTVFDAPEGGDEFIEINVCDDCLLDKVTSVGYGRVITTTEIVDAGQWRPTERSPERVVDGHGDVLGRLAAYDQGSEEEYLMRSPANARRLLASIDELENGGGIVRELAE